MEFLNSYELLHKTQSGFRPNHSCETALTYMIDSWLKAINDDDMVGVVMVDFKKAFDLVDHNLLINKLKHYRLSDETIKWVSSYLIEIFKRSMSYSGSLIWKSLPADIRQAESIISFHLRCVKWMKEHKTQI